MAWNEPGGNGNKDPWGGNRGGNQGPPDLDELLKKLQKKFASLFGGNGGRSSSGSSGGSSKYTSGSAGAIGVGIVVVILLLIWGSTGFYKVEEAQRGVVLRFGKHVETTQRGLRWHIPAPIEKVIKVDVMQIHTIPLRATMLTQDENIVDVEGSVQYQIDSATNYLFNLRMPEITLSQAAESAIRQSIGHAKMDYVITEGRGEIAVQVKDIIQKIMDRYGAGMHIVKVNIQHARPPEAVKDAFDDVTQAREDEERLKNEAQTYSNGVIPKSRGDAARIREQAEAYKSEVVDNAEGEASRFTQLLTEYRKSPEVTRERLYLSAMESVLSNSSKVLIDTKSNNNLLYLPLDKLMSNPAANDLTKRLSHLQKQQSQRHAQQNKRDRINNLRRRGTQ